MHFDHDPNCNMSTNSQMSGCYDKAIKNRGNIFIVRNLDAKLGTQEFFEMKVNDFHSSNPEKLTLPQFSRKDLERSFPLFPSGLRSSKE